MHRILTYLALLPGLLLLASCEKPAQLKVKDAVVQLSPVEGNPSAVYFNVYGGYNDVELRSVITSSALRTEMHESKVTDGVASMDRIYSVKIPAKGKVAFEPGGKHVMLWGIDSAARKAGKLQLEFAFTNGDRILVEAPIKAMGEPAAASMDDSAETGDQAASDPAS